MQRIKKQDCIFMMHTTNSYNYECNDGDRLIFETYDCFSDTVKSADDTVSTIDFECVNPATGPVYIHGAKKGDCLKVTVEKITLAKKGVIVTARGLGVLKDEIRREETVICEVDDDFVNFKGIKIPVNKMIGVIGTASSKAISTGTPDDHGGNMDCKEVCENNIIYLPVNCDGALLSIGDLHASMGDGEVCGAGIEIAGEVLVKVEVLKDFRYKLPMIETKDKYITIASKKTMIEASRACVKNMADLIIKKTKLSINEAHMLMSATANLRVCQIVDPNMTMRMEIDKKIIKSAQQK